MKQIHSAKGSKKPAGRNWPLRVPLGPHESGTPCLITRTHAGFQRLLLRYQKHWCMQKAEILNCFQGKITAWLVYSHKRLLGRSSSEQGRLDTQPSFTNSFRWKPGTQHTALWRQAVAGRVHAPSSLHQPSPQHPPASSRLPRWDLASAYSHSMKDWTETTQLWFLMPTGKIRY